MKSTNVTGCMKFILRIVATAVLILCSVATALSDNKYKFSYSERSAAWEKYCLKKWPQKHYIRFGLAKSKKYCGCFASIVTYSVGETPWKNFKREKRKRIFIQGREHCKYLLQ